MVSFELMASAMVAFALAENDVKYYCDIYGLKADFVKLGMSNNEIKFRVAIRKAVDSLSKKFIEDLE